MLDGEGSDWQSIELDIGMEVTETLEPNDGRKRSVINQYFLERSFRSTYQETVQRKAFGV